MLLHGKYVRLQLRGVCELRADDAAWKRARLYVDKVGKKCEGPGFSANGHGMGADIIIDHEGGEADARFSAATGWHGLSVELGQHGVNNPRTYRTLFCGAPRLPNELPVRAPPSVWTHTYHFIAV